MVPGVTNPATPTTSSTRTETARIPSGITAGRPAPASFGASLAARIGSFSTTAVIKAWSTQSSTRLNDPANAVPAGQAISRKSSARRRDPSDRGAAATTIWPVVTTVGPALACCNRL